VYARTVGGKEERFGVSGSLWRDALVFFDRGSGSYWSQINGKAITGAHQGARLEEIPSQMTTWGEWKRAHPETDVLRPSPESRGGSAYAGYFEDAEQFGVLASKNPDERLAGKTLVVGVRAGEGTAAVPVDVLHDTPFLQATIGVVPAVIVRTTTRNAVSYDRRIDGEEVGFERLSDGRLRDGRTGSIWDAESGRAIDGSLAGRELNRLVSRKVYWFIWAAFNPGSRILGPAEGEPGPAAE
jgi:hypothetical protein